MTETRDARYPGAPPFLRCCTVGCGALAEYEVWEERDDMPFADCYTHACAEHLSDAFTTVQEEGCRWRWGVRVLSGNEVRRQLVWEAPGGEQ